MTVVAILLVVIAANLPAQGSVAVRDLEVMCNRGIDNPGPETAGVVGAQLQRETGARASFLRGCQHLAKRDFGKAGAEFERATKESPNEAAFHFWFGRATGEQAQRANVLRQPGLARRTKGEFERAVELDSSYIPAREGLVRYYLAAPGMFGGSIDKAREQADAIGRINAYRGGLAHANVSIAAKDTAALIRAHESLASQYPDSLVPRMSLFNVHAARRNWPAAWRELDAALRLRPSLVTLRYAEGRVAAESGQQLDRGEVALRSYLGHMPAPNEPSLAAAHWRLGQIAAHRGDAAGARTAYEAALSLDPKFEPARAALARPRHELRREREMERDGSDRNQPDTGASSGPHRNLHFRVSEMLGFGSFLPLSEQCDGRPSWARLGSDLDGVLGCRSCCCEETHLAIHARV